MEIAPPASAAFLSTGYTVFPLRLSLAPHAKAPAGSPFGASSTEGSAHRAGAQFAIFETERRRAGVAIWRSQTGWRPTLTGAR
jgi:hypothetical protein